MLARMARGGIEPPTRGFSVPKLADTETTIYPQQATMSTPGLVAFAHPLTKVPLVLAQWPERRECKFSSRVRCGARQISRLPLDWVRYRLVEAPSRAGILFAVSVE